MSTYDLFGWGQWTCSFTPQCMSTGVVCLFLDMCLFLDTWTGARHLMFLASQSNGRGGYVEQFPNSI